MATLDFSRFGIVEDDDDLALDLSRLEVFEEEPPPARDLREDDALRRARTSGRAGPIVEPEEERSAAVAVAQERPGSRGLLPMRDLREDDALRRARTVGRAAGEAPTRDFAGGLLEIGEAIVETPVQVIGSAASAIRAGEDLEKDNLINDVIAWAAEDAEENMREDGVEDGETTMVPGITYNDIRRLPKQLGFSLTSAITGVVAGLGTAAATTAATAPVSGPGAPVIGVRAGWAAGTFASGVAAYRMAKDQVVSDMYELLNKRSMETTGSPMSDADWRVIREDIEDAAQEYGLWEAIPEALSNFAGLKIIRAPVKAFLNTPGMKNVFSRAVAKFVALQAVEHGTETVTGVGQQRIEGEIGLREPRDYDSIYEEALAVAKEQAVDVFLLTSVMGAGGAVASRVYDATTDQNPLTRDIDWNNITQEDADYLRNVAADRFNPDSRGMVSPTGIQIPPGEIEAAATQPAEAKPGDAESQVAGLVAEGREAVKGGEAMQRANDILSAHGAPAVGARVAVWDDEGSRPGTVVDAVTISHRAIASQDAIKVRIDDGSTVALFFGEMKRGGIQVLPEGVEPSEAPPVEPEAPPAEPVLFSAPTIEQLSGLGYLPEDIQALTEEQANTILGEETRKEAVDVGEEGGRVVRPEREGKEPGGPVQLEEGERAAERGRDVQAPEGEGPVAAGVVPTFDEVRAILPKDDAGEADLAAFTAAADGKTWPKMTDAEKVAVYAKLGGRMAEAPAEEPEAEAEPEPEAPADRLVVETGVVLRSQSGREMAPAPKVDTTGVRKTQNTVGRIDAWLLDEAKKEATAADNDYLGTLLGGINPKKMSQSDRDTINDVLFGDEDGATAANRIPATEPPATAPGKPAPKFHAAGYGTKTQQSMILARARKSLAKKYGDRVKIAKGRLSITKGTAEENRVAAEEVNRQTNITIERSEKGRKRGAPKGGAQSLNEFLAARGGIVDTGGELSAMDMDKWHTAKRFRKKFIRPGRAVAQGDIEGLRAPSDAQYGLDAAWEAAVDEGFFPEYAGQDIRALDGPAILLDAISDGDNLFRPEDQVAIDEQAAADESEAREEAYAEQFKSPEERAAFEKQLADHKSLDAAQEEAYNTLETQLAEHLDPEEMYVAGEPLTEADRERTDDEIKEAEAREPGALVEPPKGAEVAPVEGEAPGRADEEDRRAAGRARGEDEGVAPTTDQAEAEFIKGLRATTITNNPAVRASDGDAYRIKKKGDGYIAMRMSRKPGEMPKHMRPQEGKWTVDQAIDRVLAEIEGAPAPTAEPAKPIGDVRDKEIGEAIGAGEREKPRDAERDKRELQARRAGKKTTAKEQKEADEGLFAEKETPLEKAAPVPKTVPEDEGKLSRARAVTDSSAFRAWFRDSKVVDEDGKPLVVHHATDSILEGGAFDPTRKGKNFLDAGGFFFGASKLDVEGHGKHVVDVYLSLQNPLILDAGKDHPEEFWFLNRGAYLQQAAEGGHDGVIVRGEDFVDAMEGETPINAMYVAFEPTQIKSVDNLGGFDPGDPRIKFSRGRVPLVSKLLQAAEGLTQEKGGGAQMLAMLKKTPGVKVEEIAYVGIDDFLFGKKGVTKADIVEFIRANQVEVREVEKGGPPPPQGRIEHLPNGLYRVDSPGLQAKLFDTLEEAEAETERLGWVHGEPTTEFEQWQLPGGEAYRELLLTLPFRARSAAHAVDEFVQRMKNKYVAGGQWRQKITAAEEIEYQELDTALRAEPGAPSFTGGHFDEPNVLASIRFNERTDADGSRVLFVEEIQSDWHQKGRAQGYAQKASDFTADGGKDDKMWQIRDRSGTARGVFGGATAEEAIQRFMKSGDTGVSDAPFKKTWHEMALRRMVRWAAENGFDKVAWTTGEQQAERYDLSKHADQVDWIPSTGELNVYKDKENVLSQKGVTEANLEDYIGKEASEKLRSESSIRKGLDKAKTPFHRIEGEDLKVGAAGMAGFYDKMLPAYAKKFGKKFGAKVGMTTVQVGTESVYGGEPDVGALRTVGLSTAERPIHETVHSLEITPPMVEAAMAGFPLFQRPGRLVGTMGAPRADFRADAERITDDLVKRMKKLGISEKIGLRVEKTIKDRASGKASEVEGRYFDRLIQVALGAKDPNWTLDHEVIHALRDLGIIKTAEWRTLEKAAKADFERNLEVRERYADMELGEAAIVEEVIADMFADFTTGRTKVGGFLRDAFKRIQAFFRALGASFRAVGYRTVEDIFEGIERGYVGAREGVEMESMRETARPSYSLRRDGRAGKHEPTIARIIGTTDKPTSQRLRETVTEVAHLNDLAHKQGWLDQFASVEELEKEVTGEISEAGRSAFKATHLTQNLQSVMAAVLRYGPLKVKDGWFVLDENFGKGFEAIFEPLAKSRKLRLWKGWAVANRAKRLMAEGREHLLTEAEIDELLPLGDEHPEFKEVMAEWTRFNKKMLDMAMAAGLINKDQRALWEKSDYVPFFRILEDAETIRGARKGRRGLEGQRSGIRQLKGGEAQINDPLENMVLGMTSLVDRAFKNLAMQKVTALAEQTGAMEQVGKDWKPAYIPMSEVEKQIKEIMGQDFEGLTKEERSQIAKMWQMMVPRGDNIVSVMIGGKPVYYQVNDPLLLRSIISMTPPQLGRTIQILRGAKRLLTMGVTIDPAFMLANFARDTLSSWVVSGQKGFHPGVDSVKGFVKALKGDVALGRIMASGAGSGGFYRTDPADVRKMMDARMRGLDKRTLLDSPKKVWEFWQKVGQASEAANRIAISEAVRKNGGSAAEAAYQALDIMDFAMRGDYAAMRFLAETVPFLNARVQGVYRLTRGYRDNKAAFLWRGGMIMVATMAVLASNWDRPEYDALEPWDKDAYFHFWIFGRHYRLPKPFEVGAIFSTVPERMVRLLKGKDDGEKAAKRLLAMFMDTFAMNPIPQLFKPLAEQITNKVFFTGRPIESMRLERLAPEARYEPWSSETARMVADILPDWMPDFTRSPKRIEHLVRGYLGALGTYLLAASDQLVRMTGDYPVEPALRVDDIPVVKRFMKSSPARTTRYVTEFYEMQKEVGEIANTIREYERRGEYRKAFEEERKHPDVLGRSKELNRVARERSKIAKEMRVIYDDRTMSRAAKRREIDRLTIEKNRLAEEAVTRR